MTLGVLIPIKLFIIPPNIYQKSIVKRVALDLKDTHSLYIKPYRIIFILLAETLNKLDGWELNIGFESVLTNQNYYLPSNTPYITNSTKPINFI